MKERPHCAACAGSSEANTSGAPRASFFRRSSSTRSSMFERQASGTGSGRKDSRVCSRISKPKRLDCSKKSRSVSWLLLTKPQ